MPLVTKRPTAIVTNENGHWSGGVGDINDASDATFMSENNGTDNEELACSFEDFAEPVSIVSVTYRIRIKANATETGFGRIFADVPAKARETTDISTFGDTFEEKTNVIANLANESAVAFNGTNFGFECYNHSGTFNVAHVADIWAVVDYLPPAGGFAFLIGQYLGPVALVGLHEMPKIAALMRRGDRRRRLEPLVIEPHELERAWRELHEARWRKYFSFVPREA